MRTLLPYRAFPAAPALATAAVLLAVTAACNVDSPTSPNQPVELTGQNGNETATFSGSVTIFGGGSALAGSGTDIAVAVEVKDLQGNPATNFTPVNFSTSLGTIRAADADPATAGNTTQIASFAGRATVLLRSDTPGSATVTAWIANVVASTFVTFDPEDPVGNTDIVTLAFRRAGADSATIEGTAPLLSTVVARVLDETGAALTGRTVRFRIVADTAGAALTGPAESMTDGSGEAVNVVRIDAEGTVALIADLLDSSGEVVAQSNQIIATTTIRSNELLVTLTFADGATLATIEVVPDTVGLLVEVLDAETGEPLSGRRVRFRIDLDTAVVDPAELANSQSTFTNGEGIATNAVTGKEATTTVVLIVEVVDNDTGETIAISNQVVLEIE